MKLIGNVPYDVTVRMPSGAWNTFRLIYCGGSHVDPEGHYIAGGTWAKGELGHVVYTDKLVIRGIEPVTYGYDGKPIPGVTYRCGCMVKRGKDFCDDHDQFIRL